MPAESYFTFNTLTFGYYNRSTLNFVDVDSISVTHLAIPEPSTYAALLALAAPVLIFCRRRSRI